AGRAAVGHRGGGDDRVGGHGQGLEHPGCRRGGGGGAGGGRRLGGGSPTAAAVVGGRQPGRWCRHRDDEERGDAGGEAEAGVALHDEGPFAGPSLVLAVDEVFVNV